MAGPLCICLFVSRLTRTEDWHTHVIIAVVMAWLEAHLFVYDSIIDFLCRQVY